MPSLSLERLQRYRAGTFRLLPGQRLKTRDEAVEFVNQRGFVYFWPIRGITLPSLWTAVAGDRPVADAHDDPGHVTWGWKDGLLGSRQWYYAKVLRKRATMISMQMAPYFYALSENYGSPEEDYLTLYEQGRLTQEAKAIYEAVLDKGALDTVALRKAARLSSPENEGRFNKALADLQADFKLAPVAVTEAGAWHYAFAYDVVARYYPELPEQAHAIGERQAQRTLAELYFRSVGAASVGDVSKLFGWRSTTVQRTVNELVQAGILVEHVEVEKQAGEGLALTELCGY
jgi:DNA glycosylase AlkZ-like